MSFFTGRIMRQVVETVTPQRTLADVVMPAQTRRTLEQALAQVRNHTLIYRSWGLGERHTSGRGLSGVFETIDLSVERVGFVVFFPRNRCRLLAPDRPMTAHTA